MNQTERQRRGWPTAKIAVASLAGLVVLVLLFPGSGISTLPPECYSAFGYTVPCGGGLAIAAAVAMAGLVGMLLWIIGRPSHRG